MLQNIFCSFGVIFAVVIKEKKKVLRINQFSKTGEHKRCNYGNEKNK